MKKIAILMDPLATIKVDKDSTLAMILAAQEMGIVCAYFTLSDMFAQNGRVYAKTTPLTLRSNSCEWFELGASEKVALADFDVILMRKDPPFDMEYIYATYALELAEREHVLVSNKPASLRDVNEKFFTLHFPELCPPTLVSRDITQLQAFWEMHGCVIFKPLSAMGGRGVFLVDNRGLNLAVILETLTATQTVSIMAQKFIPEIQTAGDKRILVIDGVAVPYALARLPKHGECRGNLAAGGHGKVVELNQRDRDIVAVLAPTLRAKGLHCVGIDVIGDYLTEINVTSPTCMREISQATGLDIAGDYIRVLQKKTANCQVL